MHICHSTVTFTIKNLLKILLKIAGITPIKLNTKLLMAKKIELFFSRFRKLSMC